MLLAHTQPSRHREAANLHESDRCAALHCTPRPVPPSRQLPLLLLTSMNLRVDRSRLDVVPFAIIHFAAVHVDR